MTMTSSEKNLRSSLDILEVKPGLRFSVATLQALLPDVETLLFFGKVYDLDYVQLSNLMHQVLKSELADELFGGEHSTDLQGYLVGYEDEWGNFIPGIVPPHVDGDVEFDVDVPHGEILPEMWKSLEVDVAQSLKDVAAKLEDVVGLMPGKQGSMVFNSMMKLNAKRPVIGDYRAQVQHARQKENLLILDVSGSVTSGTIHKIVDDVVAMSYMANAHMAIVSNTCTHWDPGTYSSDGIVGAAEFGGTYYETLEDLLQRDWGVVITVADYDSSMDAKRHIKSACHGHIDQVLDISLVNRPTFLAECVGQLADEVRPLLIARSMYVLSN